MASRRPIKMLSAAVLALLCVGLSAAVTAAAPRD